MMPISILIVDGKAAARQGIKRKLRLADEFVIVGEADSAADAIEKVLSLKPNVVLMDLNLPDKSGIELTKELIENAPEANVLLLATNDDQRHISKIIKAGALGYILKDVNSNTLQEAIKAVAQGYAYIQPCLLTKLITEFREILSDEKMIKAPSDLGLTQREMEIVSYIACGQSNKDIARKLFISEKTVKNHVSSILKKMELGDRTQVAVYAYKKGLVAR
ncbi:MAG: response regulator transcription factor [Firmicutes bacterium]|nr:response regulator transcription factor [Bacillota bacterium]